MKKLFVKFSMLLILLVMSVNAAWGQISLGDIDLQNPATWFYVNLEAKVSTPACGSNPGQVKLNYTNTRREQDNPWITDTKPVNPYKDAAEIEEDLNEKWQTAFNAGDGAAASYEEKPDYPTAEESEGWTEAQIEAAAAGYTTGWDWAKAGHDYSNYPQNPYTRQQDLKGRWDDGYNEGLNAAKNGQEKQTPDVSGLDSDQAQALIAGYNAAYDWYVAGRYLNVVTGASVDEYQTAWGSSANLNGYAMFHMEGVDSALNGMFSSYAYFEAKVKENDGWYFTGWSFTEGESDLGGAVDTDTPSDKGKLFKIFPADDPGWANKSLEYVYATFKPVMVANYAVNGTIDLTPGNGNSGNNTVIFDVQGDRVSADDFTASVASADTEGYAGHGSCVASAALVNGQIVVTVTYTASDAVSGIYRANVTLASKSGCSSLTAPMYIRVSPVAGSQAALYNGKAIPANFVEAGDLNTLLGKATAEQTVALNANYADVVTINKDVTFDLNGYTLSNNMVVSGGNVTLAYSKYKGKITKTVAVQSGATLTLNGGTIEVSGAGNPFDPSDAVVAVNVANGGKLIQNGATISATASTCYAIGINVDGEAEVKDGSIAAHAGMTAAFAAQVSATGKLTTTGGAFNASVDQTHNPTAVPTDQSTWSNAYAVYVAATTGEANIKGGTFYSTSSYDGAFAVCALATFGKLTIEKGAIVAAHTVRNLPVAYAVGSMGSADLTVNGGRFSATYVEDEQVKPCPPFLCAGFANLDFKAGYIKADSVYVRDAMFEQTASLVQPKLYNITYKGKDYNDGYRYLAVREGLDAKEYGMQAARIGTTGYTSIADALDYANNNRDKDVVIILQNDDVLPAGYYTLPSKATLIIPMKNEQETGNPIIPRIASTSGSPVAYVQPYAYVTLTVASGANIDVHGLIEVSGTQRATDGSYAAHPHGPCGFVIMQEGSNMTMQSGSELRAWGFIIGKGETDVRRDATVREQFQMGDWKGGSTSFGMLNDSRRVFPLTHYYIQNIESPFKYHPGAVLSTTTAVSATFGVTVTASANDIKVVGVSGRDDAMFLMDNEADADNTWVRKWYDVENDLQVYDVNNSAHIGSMVLDLGKLGNTPLQMNSGYFVLPITCNFKIHLLSGMMDFTQNTALLPGAEVEVDKEAVVTVVKNNDESVLSGSLYIYDADQWDKYAYDESGIKYTKPVQYAAGFGGKPTARAEQFNDKSKLKDATINVHGSFAINEEGCFLYTSEGGANIFSSNEDAGTFVFNVAGPTESTQEQVWQVKNRSAYTNNGDVNEDGVGDGDYFTAAQLKNKDGHEPAFTGTTGYSANSSLCYMDDEWRYRMFFDCYAADVNMATYAAKVAQYGNTNPLELGKAVEHIYIKPQEWVEISGIAAINYDENPYNPYLESVTGNTDHTYSDAAGAGRLFILMDNCQWWEVEKKDNLYHCIHPNNDTYYYWQGETPDPNDEEATIPAHWEEKRFTITWKNWDGTPLETIGPDETPVTEYSVTYGTMAEFLGTNPTRESNIDYTYDFTGWSPTPGKVTSDVTYTATYTQKPRKYTIIFCQEGGVEIERQFLTHNEVPVCENTPTKIGHTLVWSPAIAAVTGDATYTATWEENPPTEYQITFYDYNGTSVLKQGNVNVGDMPVPPAQVNGKPATSEFTYVFDHWSPAVEKVSATSIKSYTAVYREVAKAFPVNFYFGSKSAENQIGATQFLEIGQDPVIPNDERLQKTEDNANVYQLVWTPQIQTVIGHEDDYTYEYVASYISTPKQYSLTLKCTPSGAATITGARADYTYGATPTVTVTPNPGYNFLSWSDSEPIGEAVDGTYSRTVEINGNIELTVVCECPDCDKSTIIWKNEAGDAELATDLVPVGSATIYHAATPTKENSLDGQYSYTFYGWTTEANEGGTKYKNGMTPKVAEAENPAEQTYTYYACFTPVVRQYNVTLSSNIPNVCMLVGAGTYNYSESAANATVIVSGYDAVNYTFDGWYNGEDQVSTAESYSFAVQSDVDLVAKFTPVTYTITWKSEDGNSTLETDVEQSYGATTAYNSAEPTKTDHSFIGWTTAANGEGSYYAKGATPAVAGNATYYAYFAENTRSLEIGATGSETLTEATDYTTFTITSNGVNSGQLINANNLSLLGEAIFKLQPASAIPARTWYAVAAPWQVDVRTGIYANGKHLTVGRDFDIIEFNAESYAVNEAGEGNKNIWRYVEENGGVMQPGKLYMIYLASAQSSLEFHKTGGGISTTTLSLTTTSGSGDKANWNAIANPALYHADLNMTVIADASQDVLQYINGGYTPTSASNLIVGAPIFVQVNNPQSTVNANVHGIAPAPYRRAPQAQTADNRFVVEIARNGMMNDRLIVQTADEKDNTYVIGQDLAKMGIGSKAAQIWMERYNTNLCKNTVEMENGRAEYPLSIFAPAAGEYTISAMQQRGNETLYLTRDGEAIWNLSDGDYAISLSRGTTADYGLRISARTPQVATGCDEVIADGVEETQKVLVNNQIFIIRGDKVYTIDGQLVK